MNDADRAWARMHSRFVQMACSRMERRELGDHPDLFPYDELANAYDMIGEEYPELKDAAERARDALPSTSCNRCGEQGVIVHDQNGVYCVSCKTRL